MKQVTTYVGIDAHKKDLFVAMLVGTEKTPVSWQLANEPQAVRRLVRKLEREAPGPVHVFYEAGPCGYALQRQMTTPRVSCDVVAPALIPRKPGERVKTNRRDSRKLVELGRAGLLTAVQPPTPEDEAVRDLARARDDAREDLQRCRHRLGKLLLRRGLHFSGRNWTRTHRQWVDSLTWTTRPSGPSWTIICWRSTTPRRAWWSWMHAWPRSRQRTRIGTGRMVALFPGHRYVDGDGNPRRVA
jgi:transposase